MKPWLTATLLFAVLISTGAFTQADPPPVAQQVPAPPATMKDGPFRLLLPARTHAQLRRAQGFRADIMKEGGFWWVVYYP
jgi:hypothetical protein